MKNEIEKTINRLLEDLNNDLEQVLSSDDNEAE